jgi:hypothetical protein
MMKKFLSLGKVPSDPEEIADPKKYLVDLARRSRKRTIRDDLVPAATARVGRLYNSLLVEYIRKYWRIEFAIKQSESLNRFIRKIKDNFGGM